MKTLTNFLILFFTLSCNAQVSNSANTGLNLAETLDSLNIDKSMLSLLIDKSDYRLYVRFNEQILKEYPVVFGKNTNDDKLRQGDNCTPEGNFHMISKYPHKEWSKFIWINYPNSDSWKKHNSAIDQGRIPKDAAIGGEVGIHGVPEGMDFLIDKKYNWTLGCISLKNKDVDELYPFITKNTLIEIRK
jgi:murein L,D-transpeptidase YafK